MNYFEVQGLVYGFACGCGFDLHIRFKVWVMDWVEILGLAMDLLVVKDFVSGLDRS